MFMTAMNSVSLSDRLLDILALRKMTLGQQKMQVLAI